MRTGVILDHNQHTVPDGTVVRFTMLLSGEGGGIIQQVDQVTTRGMARASFALEKPGLVEIRASSEPAVLSDVVQIDVSSGQPAACYRNCAHPICNCRTDSGSAHTSG